MKIFTLKTTATLVAIFFIATASAQLCSGSGRYIDDNYFSSFKKTTVKYSTNAKHEMDVYEPVGDTETDRPLIIFAHGGSFTGGSKTQDVTVVELCQRYAKRGYVTASINYRLGTLGDMLQAQTAYNVVIRAVSDGKAAVRWFRKNADSVNTFGINPDLIYGGGNSAGAVLFIHLAYIDSVEEITNAQIKTAMINNGGIEGNSGNPGYSSKINAVINLAGGINDTSWISAGNPPIVSFHGTTDNVVPYNCANAQGGLTPAVLCGTGAMQPRIENLGLDNNVLLFPGDGHVPWESSNVKLNRVDSLTKVFMYRQVCNALSGGATCNTARFRDEIFDIDSFEVEYTTVRNTRNKMDIFVPKNDPATRRPLIVFAHGGGFTAGDKAADVSVNYMKKAFAKRGYVTASIQYRLATLLDLADSLKMLREVVWAMGDAKAAVRYMTKDAATTNLYKIDPDYVFIGGNSAGAILAVHYAYIDSLNELPQYVRDTILAYGGLEGDVGNDGYPSAVKAVISLAGGINQTSWISNAQEEPIFMAHGVLDGTVPYNFDMVYRSQYGFLDLVTLHGSGSMDTALAARGVQRELKSYPNSDHSPWDTNATILQEVDLLARDFLYPMVCNDFTADGPTSIKNIVAHSGVTLYPNPNNGSFFVRIDNFTEGTVLEVYNPMGQLVKQAVLNSAISNIMLDDVSTGLYTVRISENNNNKFVSRILVR